MRTLAASIPPNSDSNYRSAGGRLKAIATVILIIGGGIGNLIDRIFRGFVIDYLSLSFFPPICNFADYCITIGAVLFVLCILFQPDKKKKAEPEESDESE